jgi:hypothetical protein
MTPAVPLRQRAAISATAIAWALLILVFLLGLPVVLVWPKLLFFGIAALALLLGALLVGLWWALRRRDRRGWPVAAWLKASLALLMLLVGLVSLPVYYLSFEVDAHPSALPQATLSNGSKTVVFQGMMHVGSESFYKSVVYDLEKALSEGYTLFYEGVQPSPGEGDQWFRDYITGGGDLSDSYKMLGSVCGLQFQLDYFALLATDMKARPERHVTADVSALDMKREFDRLVKSDPAFAAQVRKKPAAAKAPAAGGDTLDFFTRYARDGTPAQRNILGILCRGVLNLTASQPGDGALAPVVLDFRNRHLVKQIVEHPSKKIYITYGAAHLPGVIAVLKAQDPQWRVVSTKWMRSIGAPEHLTGTLVQSR